MRWSARAGWLAALGLALSLLPEAAKAAEVGPDQTGWWYELNQAPPPIPAPPPPPTVPPGGLFVSLVSSASIPSGAGGLPVNAPVRGTVAYGAVLYTVPSGSTGDLVLRTASGSTAATAKLQACNVAAAWNPADGGPWFAQPGYDSGRCTGGRVAADGASVTFPVGHSLTLDGRLDVAIVPAADATPFAVTFARPGSRSLRVMGAAHGSPVNTRNPGAAASPAPAGPAPSPIPDIATPGLGSGSQPGTFIPSAPGSKVAPQLTALPTQVPSQAASSPTTSAVIASHRPNTWDRLILAAMLVALIGGWIAASRPGLVFLFASAGEQRRQPTNHDLFGIGPFAKHRSGPPQTF